MFFDDDEFLFVDVLVLLSLLLILSFLLPTEVLLYGAAGISVLLTYKFISSIRRVLQVSF